jgi:HEAT repeat protein
MSQGSKRLLRRSSWLVLALAAIGGLVGWKATAIQVRYTAHTLRTAASDEQRLAAAARLLDLGDTGTARLVDFLRDENPHCRLAAAQSIQRHLSSSTAGDPRVIVLASRLLDTFALADEAGRRAVLELLPQVLERTGAAEVARCREAVVVGFTLADPAARVLSIRLGLHPDLKVPASQLLPLMNDPDALVRQTALFAAGSMHSGEGMFSDEDLFHWLHDPDEGVRKVCYDVLASRDRTDGEINLARRFSHPDAAERLKLLLDLRYDEEVVDPEPWLERLGRDPEPAVRAGAARVALEVQTDRHMTTPGWVMQIARADPDPTVRRVADWFLRQSAHREDPRVRPASGP